MKKTLIYVISILALTTAVLGQPQPPHHIYGTITDDSGSVDTLSINFLHSGSSIASTQTDSSGNYSIELDYSSNYDNQEIQLKVEDVETGKTVNFTSGKVERLDYAGSGIIEENFTVSGNIELNGSDADNDPVSFYYDGSEIESGQTNGTGYYELEINYSNSYSGEDIELYVDGNSTGETTTFVSGGSSTLDYSESSSGDENDNDDSNDDSGGSSSGGDDNSDDSDDSDSDNEDSSDDSSEEEENNSESSSDSSSTNSGYRIISLDLDPQNPSPGEQVTITIEVENEGNQTESFEVEINAGDELLSEETDDISPGETATVDYEKSFDREAQYDISAGDLETTLEVSEASSDGLPLLGIGGILGLLIIIGVIGYRATRGKESSDEDGSKGAFNSFRESKEQDEEGFDWRFADEE